MFRTFKRSWRYYDDELGAERIIPSGWQGELSEALAKQADKAGVTLLQKTKAKAEATSDDTTEGSGKAKSASKVAGKPSAEVVAARKAVTEAEKAVAAGGSDDEKAKAEADLKAAQDALAALEA